ncbi:hypothetical protein M8C21_006553, partial [Ambrosia artemisiifolia]
FIGYVQLCNDLDPVTKRNGIDTPKINFKLRDLDGVEINASLWEQHVVAMSTFMNDKNRDPHVTTASLTTLKEQELSSTQMLKR